SDVLGMPCRHQGVATRCLHGFAPEDPVRVRVPLDWADHAGITRDGPFCIAEGLEVLTAAWQAQQSAELAEAQAEQAQALAAIAAASTDAEEDSASSDPGASVGSENSPSESGESAVSDSPACLTPVQRQRQQIAGFLTQHLSLRVDHPWATPCHRCQHRLEGSPTKDETVPPCAWAARLREVRFSRLQLEAGGPAVPVCGQFAPDARWAELIPEHPASGTLPREWLHRQILLLARLAAPRHSGARTPFEFLTGRPMTKSEAHGDWFQTQLAAQVGELTDAQLYTLFLWAHEEHQRGSASFSLPVAGGQFIPVQEVAWTPTLPKEEVADA
ncbi:MAG: hypothetical protein H0T73_09765, partial [Ardenticatenales bacterium]|nr:hypothetical protein [Ardenticatenales bacterium]